MCSIRWRYEEEGYSEEAASLIVSSWRPETQTAYNHYIALWKGFASKNSINLSCPLPLEVANFLAHLFKEGASYTAVNTARSALSAFLPLYNDRSVGSHPDVCRIIKGVFEERPALPKYRETWDVNTVLDYFDSQPAISDMSLKQLTLRMCKLLALLTGQRGQALHLLKVEDLKMQETKCTIFFSEKHKQSRHGVHTEPAEILAFNSNPNLCLVKHLKRYLEQTKNMRSSNQLLISYEKPHVPVVRQTFSRWVKCVLAEAGIDTCKYASHSTYAASCSASVESGVSLGTTLKSAGWSSDRTFTKFYKRQTERNFGQLVLDAFLKNK